MKMPGKSVLTGAAIGALIAAGAAYAVSDLARSQGMAFILYGPALPAMAFMEDAGAPVEGPGQEG